MNPITRRQFIRGSAAAAATGAVSGMPRFLHGAPAAGNIDVDDRIRGLIFGSAIGDALGGPIEFQSRASVQTLDHPPKVWRDGETLDAAARSAAAARVRLRSYNDLRPGTESYGQWNPHSPSGTITDDTRHKLVLFHGLHQADQQGRWPFGVRDLAQAYLDWPTTDAVKGRPGYEELARDWLEEWQLGARWVLGERDLTRALPPERMWQSLPTCCGQMTLLPLAAIFAGRPTEAYLATYRLGFFDNGFGKDLNASLVAGLAEALVTPAERGGDQSAFERVIATMRSTDPLRFGKIRWTERAVDRWLNLALKLARAADGRPARLFDALELEFAKTTKWEAQVPFVVAFACLEIAAQDPLAALQLSLEWGHDTDSFAQLTGAFVGALHGSSVFSATWKDAVAARLKADHGVDLEKQCRFLSRLRGLARQQSLVANA